MKICYVILFESKTYIKAPSLRHWKIINLISIYFYLLVCFVIINFGQNKYYF